MYTQTDVPHLKPFPLSRLQRVADTFRYRGEKKKSIYRGEAPVVLSRPSCAHKIAAVAPAQGSQLFLLPPLFPPT